MQQFKRVLLLALPWPLIACDDALTPRAAPARFTAVATGGAHACALSVAGHVYCWGVPIGAADGAAGGAIVPQPERVLDGEPFTAVAAGENHACALASRGVVYCWGANARGQLGNAGQHGGFPLASVAIPTTVVQLTAGWQHACALGTTGAAYCWGANEQGQLGDSARLDRALPVRVAGDGSYTEVTAGGFHTCGLQADGRAFCWGLNQLGQLGTGNTVGSDVPVPVATELLFQSISAGYTHTCGVATDSLAYCWGSDARGELASTGFVPPDRPGARSPSAVFLGLRMRQVSAGNELTCGITIAGEGYCWGRGSEGQLGNGLLRDWPLPLPIAPPEGAGGYGEQLRPGDVAAGKRTHSCAVAAGRLYCWGSGVLGYPGRTFATVPVPLALTAGS
ncbi:MAG: RCC1 domain-containing protein [Longimicrobiales bacterium]